MKIIVKSTWENWTKEFHGKKPNTVRNIEDFDDGDVVEVQLVGEPLSKKSMKSFTRKITDLTIHDGRLIISWE